MFSKIIVFFLISALGVDVANSGIVINHQNEAEPVYASSTSVLRQTSVLSDSGASESVQDIRSGGFKHSPLNVKSYISSLATEYGVDPFVATYIAERESGYGWWGDEFNPAIESKPYLCNNKRSKNFKKLTTDRGIWQISSCWWDTIPDDVAFDPIKSTEWALPYVKSNPNLWAVYKFCEKFRGNNCPLKK